MPFERFYIDCPLENIVEIQDQELHHLCHVMRIEVDEMVEVVNGQGSIANAKVLNISKKKAELEIVSLKNEPLPNINLSIAVPFLRLSKLELIIEKCTEIGAFEFLLYPADFSEKDDLTEHQLQRLTHIAISAMKQCGRLYLPQITLLKKFDDLFSINLPLFFGDTQTQENLFDKKESALFVTGPEKGFSEKERDKLLKHGKSVSLNKNILRAETAPIVASSILYF